MRICSAPLRTTNKRGGKKRSLRREEGYAQHIVLFLQFFGRTFSFKKKVHFQINIYTPQTP